MIKEVKAVEIIDGVLHINTSATWAADDGLHNNRPLNTEEQAEYDKRDATKMYISVPDTE